MGLSIGPSKLVCFMSPNVCTTWSLLQHQAITDDGAALKYILISLDGTLAGPILYNYRIISLDGTLPEPII